MLNIYIANLGKYNEGELVGEWVNLPITEEELEAVYKRIGISEEPDEDGNFYEETAIHNFDTDLPLEVGEWDDVLELSQMVEGYEDLDEWEQHTVAAIIEATGCTLAEAVENVESYSLYEGVNSDEDLGYFYYESGAIEIPDNLVNYFDFEAYGRDCSFDGTYTEYGFLLGA